MKYPGNASIALRDDGRVCAIGGWDGKYVSSLTVLRNGMMECGSPSVWAKTGCAATFPSLHRLLILQISMLTLRFIFV